MAVIRAETESRKATRPVHSSFQALTAAALALPGLVLPGPAQAAEGEAGFQYGHYKEGKRNLFGVDSAFSPIEVETLQGNGNFTLSDRIKFAFVYSQDTWSGATPVSTAPRDLRGNRSRAPDGVSGATPIINGQLFFDSKFNVLKTDGFGNLTGGAEKQLVHTLSSASPETRKQGDFKLSYEWDEAALDVGGGISLERDYESRWGDIRGRLDFNRKLTSLNLGLKYINSAIDALLDPDILPYVDTSLFDDRIDFLPATGDKILRDRRQDWAAGLGLSQVLSKDSLIEAGVGYTYSTGYMENPYKVVQVAFIDPAQQFLAPPGGFFGDVQALLEQRPEVRHQWSANVRYVQYVSALDASLHLGYRYFLDDWGIDAHTFEAEWGQPVGNGWTITPRVRYYSQDAADFYTPFVISRQAKVGFDPKKLPDNFSSDHRLSGFGALSGGVTIGKQFAKGVAIEAGFEYYTHEGSLKLGGGGEEDFADFDYWVANAALKVDLSALSLAGLEDSHDDRNPHRHHHGAHAPAGVMFDHMLPKAGDFMVGYRYMYGLQDGDMLHGTKAASDRAIINRGCGGTVCRVKSEEMSMDMHMLELMYTPTDWLNLMLMPQFVDMDMKLDQLSEAPQPPLGTPPAHLARHGTGGVGDTVMAALFKLFEVPGHHVHLGLGLSAPTGDVDIKLRRAHQADPEFIHYGMQLGSGTWDLLPSLTYTGERGRWSFGGQLSGIKRLEHENESGYALGDQFQATAWGGYDLAHWLPATVRGVYTAQGSSGASSTARWATKTGRGRWISRTTTAGASGMWASALAPWRRWGDPRETV